MKIGAVRGACHVECVFLLEDNLILQTHFPTSLSSQRHFLQSLRLFSHFLLLGSYFSLKNLFPISLLFILI